MNEEGNNNILAEVLGSLINNKGNGENTFGGNWVWIIFLVFMMMWGGNGFGFGGFGNRGFFGGTPATQGDVMASSAWGQTQDALRDVIQTVNNDAQGVVQAVREVNQSVGATNQALAQLGYNSLAQNNETNQQIAQQGFNLQTAVMAGNNMLQGAIMAGNSMIQSAIQQMNGDTKLAICQSTNATQNAILQTSAATQSAIQQMNGDNKLSICQANNATQATVNANSNAIQAAIRETGNNAIQGITSLGFLTQQKTDELKYELAKSTCAITANETANTQKVLDKLCQMESNQQAQRIQELQIANQALMLTNQVKDLQAGQIATASYIISQVNPQARPAWIVSSPYQSATTPTTTG